MSSTLQMPNCLVAGASFVVAGANFVNVGVKFANWVTGFRFYLQPNYDLL